MDHEIRKHSAKIGLSPGSFIYTGEKKVEEVKISVIDYNRQHLEKHVVNRIEDTFPYNDSDSVSWINIDGLHEVEILQKINEHYEIHPLVIEDILSTNQRPKIEFFDNYIYIVTRMMKYDEKQHVINSEQISLILGKNFVITFQEVEGDIFDPLRQRIANENGRIRRSGADYLAYAILDIIVDNYFLILDTLGDEIESLDEKVLENASDEGIVKQIHHLKRELLFLRKSTWPLREVISNLQREESKLIKKQTIRFVNDLYDHTIQVIDTVETYREMASGILDLYLTSISNRMNEVMKVLTIIATIFIPLSFIAGIYGMNFDTAISPFNMPELGFRYGYLIFWMLTVGIAGGLLIFFRKKRWL